MNTPQVQILSSMNIPLTDPSYASTTQVRVVGGEGPTRVLQVIRKFLGMQQIVITEHAPYDSTNLDVSPLRHPEPELERIAEECRTYFWPAKGVA